MVPFPVASITINLTFEKELYMNKMKKFIAVFLSFAFVFTLTEPIVSHALDENKKMQ